MTIKLLDIFQIKPLEKYSGFFFVGVAGVGMSAIAQYLAQSGFEVAGADRRFSTEPNCEIRKQLELVGVKCYCEDGNGINNGKQLMVVSTAIEKTNPAYQKANKFGLDIAHRSVVLAAIVRTKRTIAIAGTSGKSTTVAMTFHIMEQCGLQPSLITGAGLSSLIHEGKIGNAHVGNGEWLVVEADESDGSLVNYNPEIGVLLNIDKDHMEMDELLTLFQTFLDNSDKIAVINHNCLNSKKITGNEIIHFGNSKECEFAISDYKNNGFNSTFRLNEAKITVPIPGAHNMENAVAAIVAATQAGVELQKAANAILSFEGLYRRFEIIGQKSGVVVVDDYAHNPAKIGAAIRASQQLGKRVIVWFQPHGFAPLRFLRDEFVQIISSALRKQDQFWASDIYFAGGTVTRDISSADLVSDIKQKGAQAHYCPERKNLPNQLKSKLLSGDVILLCGARDPTLAGFAKWFFDNF